MADEYVVVNKTDLTSIADTIRGALGSADNIPVGDLGSKLIESIEAVGGGNVVFGSFVPSDSSEIIIENAFPYDYAPEIFGVCEFSPSLSFTDTSHTVTRLNSLIAKGFNVTRDQMYIYSLNISPVGTFAQNCYTDFYVSFRSTFRSGNSYYNLMEGIIDGATRNLRFKPLSGGEGFIAGRTYYYFLIFRS